MSKLRNLLGVIEGMQIKRTLATQTGHPIEKIIKFTSIPLKEATTFNKICGLFKEIHEFYVKPKKMKQKI